MILIPIILFFGILFWDVTTDVSKWKQAFVYSSGHEFDIKHTKEAWIRIVLLIPSTILFTVIPIYPHINFWFLPVSIGMQFFWFWFLFDGMFNIFRGFAWFKVATLDYKEKSKLDGIPMRTQKILKFTGIILLTFLYLYLCLK